MDIWKEIWEILKQSIIEIIESYTPEIIISDSIFFIEAEIYERGKNQVKRYVRSKLHKKQDFEVNSLPKWFESMKGFGFG